MHEWQSGRTRTGVCTHAQECAEVCVNTERKMTETGANFIKMLLALLEHLLLPA